MGPVWSGGTVRFIRGDRILFKLIVKFLFVSDTKLKISTAVLVLYLQFNCQLLLPICLSLFINFIWSYELTNLNLTLLIYVFYLKITSPIKPPVMNWWFGVTLRVWNLKYMLWHLGNLNQRQQQPTATVQVMATFKHFLWGSETHRFGLTISYFLWARQPSIYINTLYMIK